MADRPRLSPEAETPVNPYSLLEAVNASSDTAHTGWLIFLAIMTYLVVAVAGVTHEALLLETPVELPILQVKIQLKQFFQFAPVVLVLFHLGILAQLVLLARKTIEFDQAIRYLELNDKRTHPLRLELHNFFFVQAIAGPQRSAVMSGFLNLMSWLTIVILPVVLLLYMQVAFLPYHDVTTTWINRIFLTIDIVGVLLIGVFLMRAEASFFQAFWRTAFAYPISSVVTALMLAAVAYLSYFVATVPGEPLDSVGRKLLAWSVPSDGKVRGSGFALPFLSASADGTLFGIFRRNLDVTDSDLVASAEPGASKNLRLRGRDLRYAKLDRTDFAGADLTGARLDGASLVGANFENASLACADPDTVMLSDNRVAARCVSAKGANLAQARLGGAHLWGIDLTGANLVLAQLDGADLSNAVLAGADLANAHLDKADLTGGVEAQGVNLLNASLQGADLTGAQLQFADLSSAALQGAVLSFAQLDGAVLRDANVEGTSLQQARLIGTDMTGMKMIGSDLRGAVVWMAVPPAWDSTGLTDLSELAVRAPDEAERARMKAAMEPIGDAGVRRRALEVMGEMEKNAWTGSLDQQRWQSWVGASPPPPAMNYKTDLTTYLTKLMCSARWANGAIATGVARRAMTQQFRGDVVAVYDALKAPSCPAAGQAPGKVMRELSAAAETARSTAPSVPTGFPGTSPGTPPYTGTP